MSEKKQLPERLNVPFPAAWERGVSRQERSIKVGQIVAAILVFSSVGMAFDEFGAALFFASLSVLVLSFIAFRHAVAIVPWNRGRGGVLFARVRNGVQVTMVPYARRATASRHVLHMCFALFCIIAPFSVEGMIESSTRYESILVLFGSIGPYLALIVVPHSLGWLLRGRRRLGVSLGASGVYHCSWFGCAFFPWSAVRVVAATEGSDCGIGLVVTEMKSPFDGEETFFGRIGGYREKLSVIHGGYLAINPAVALRMVQFYHEHPELRDELGTEASLDRIRRADFDVEDEPAGSGTD